MTTRDSPSAPRFPELCVEVRPYLDKPMAVMAMVRRALQKAGHGQAAAAFTEQALASDPQTLLDVVEAYVTVP